MRDDEYEDQFCNTCGHRIDVEFRDFSTSIVNRYRGHCACTEKDRAEKEARERYDFRNGCRDKRYKQPTLGDLLRSKMR